MNSSPAEPGRTPARPRRLELKADRPRQIDQYIDYFGDGAARRAVVDDHPAAPWAEGGDPGHDAQTPEDSALT